MISNYYLSFTDENTTHFNYFLLAQELINKISLLETSILLEELKDSNKEIMKTMNDIKNEVRDKMFLRKEYVSFYTEMQKQKIKEGNYK